MYQSIFQFLQSPNLSFDMTGSLTSTPTHAGGLISSLSSNIPTAQSTPLVTRHQGSLLTTPTLGSDISAHSTPKVQKFSPVRDQNRNQEAPRTPTPFKRALAEVYRGREPLSNTPQTPTKRVEDITEIIKKDMQDFTDLSFNNSGDHTVGNFKKKYQALILQV